MTEVSLRGKVYNVDYCPQCGKPKWWPGLGTLEDTGGKTYCTCHEQSKPIEKVAYGWQCPVCGQVNAPWVAQCSGWHGVKYTTSGTGTISYK